MAESTLSVTLNSLRIEVGNFLGWGRDQTVFTSNNNTDFSYISERALRRFYYPPMDQQTPYYEWSFLRKTGQITLVTNTWAYDLPDDFGGTILDHSLAYNTAGTKQPPPGKIPEGQLRQQIAGVAASKRGYPLYYSVRNKDHAANTGQRWQWLCTPTPGITQNAAIVDYRYVYVPDKLGGANIYPAGGAQYSQVILAAHLAEAELLQENDPEGVYNMQFNQLLITALRNDENQKLNQRGGRA